MLKDEKIIDTIESKNYIISTGSESKFPQGFTIDE